MSTSQEAPSDSKLSGRNKRTAEERKYKNELKKTEDRIAVLEERNEEIDMLMTQEEVYSNSVKCQELALEKDAKVLLRKRPITFNLSNLGYALYFVQLRIAKVKTTFCLCENSTLNKWSDHPEISHFFHLAEYIQDSHTFRQVHLTS